MSTQSLIKIWHWIPCLLFSLIAYIMSSNSRKTTSFPQCNQCLETQKGKSASETTKYVHELNMKQWHERKREENWVPLGFDVFSSWWPYSLQEPSPLSWLTTSSGEILQMSFIITITNIKPFVQTSLLTISPSIIFNTIIYIVKNNWFTMWWGSCCYS